MSLTSFIKIPEIKMRFKQDFPIPKIKLDTSIVAPPHTKNYTGVGTTFDYLVRFYIKHVNPKSKVERWVAELGMDTIRLFSGRYAAYIKNDKYEGVIPLDEDSINSQSRKVKEASKKWIDESKPAEKILANAKKEYEKFIKDGKISDALCKSALELVHLDAIYRTKVLYPRKEISEQDIEDLKKLYDVFVKTDIIKKKQKIRLNPTFGNASRLVGGADADLIIDKMLIDIKVTKNLKFTQDMYNQLIGYYVLSQIMDKPIKITHVGIYFARHGVLHTISIKDIIRDVDFEKFVTWFKKSAEICT